jgi:hypothetical protein
VGGFIPPKVAQRVAERLIRQTGLPPVPSTEEIAEALAAAVNDDPWIQEANDPYHVTAEDVMPLAAYLRQDIEEGLRDELDQYARKAREFEEDFGRPWWLRPPDEEHP